MLYQLPIQTVKTSVTDTSFSLHIYIYSKLVSVAQRSTPLLQILSILVWSLQTVMVLILTVPSEERVQIPPPLFDWMSVVGSVHFDESRLDWVGEVEPHTTPPPELPK